MVCQTGSLLHETSFPPTPHLWPVWYVFVSLPVTEHLLIPLNEFPLSALGRLCRIETHVSMACLIPVVFLTDNPHQNPFSCLMNTDSQALPEASLRPSSAGPVVSILGYLLK